MRLLITKKLALWRIAFGGTYHSLKTVLLAIDIYINYPIHNRLLNIYINSYDDSCP